VKQRERTGTGVHEAGRCVMARLLNQPIGDAWAHPTWLLASPGTTLGSVGVDGQDPASRLLIALAGQAAADTLTGRPVNWSASAARSDLKQARAWTEGLDPARADQFVGRPRGLRRHSRLRGRFNCLPRLWFVRCLSGS
jgi:hypothetical protein